MRKKKIREFIVGRCGICNQEHRTTNGGWIINAEHKLFCHKTCFDIYLNNNQLEKRRTHYVW
tara:strand:+ start:250 stop:435 length:186 start_codon:yes stop_codon:yes gene_type:complete